MTTTNLPTTTLNHPTSQPCTRTYARIVAHCAIRHGARPAPPFPSAGSGRSAGPCRSTVGRGTPVMCRNDQGKAISLPVDFLYRTGIKQLTTMAGAPLTIEALGSQALITVKTNYSSWHEITVGEDTALATWQNGSVTAEKCAKSQLLGIYGMYVVTQASRATVDAYRCNATMIGGIYVR